MKRIRQLLVCVAAGFAAYLSGCKVGPNYQPPMTTMPAKFGELPATQPGSAARLVGESDNEVRWWRRFNDPMLTGLVEQAVLANPNVTIAQARLVQARAQRQAAQALLY